MSNHDIVLLIIGLALAASITWLGFAFRKAINITVQAPTALIPDDVRATLVELNEKMRPKLSPVDDSKLSGLVYEGVATAERSDLKGRDRFNIAKKYVLERCASMMMAVEEADVARRIEAAVSVNKKPR